MACEQKRGCGFRKIGGTYLESDPGGFFCGRLPMRMSPCPLCGHVPPFSRGLQQVTPKEIAHTAQECSAPQAHCFLCPLSNIMDQQLVGLHWVGERFYTPQGFTQEAQLIGISRRVPWPIPKWFKVGETWIFLAHIAVFKEKCEPCNGAGLGCEECDGTGQVPRPGIFHAFKPQRIVRIIPDTMPQEEREQLREQGLSLVEVRHDDPDHRNDRKRTGDE